MNKFFVILSCLLGYIVSDLVFLSELQADTKNKCSSFSCSTAQNKDKHCVQAYGDNADGTRKVDMNACFKNSTCVTPVDVFTGNTNSTKECVLTPKVEPKMNRFPGEPCTDENTCVMVPRKQEDDTWKTVANTCNATNFCAGPTGETKNCVSDLCCNAGSYCKIEAEATVGDCVPQVGDQGACELSLDCANTHVCYKKKCTAAYSFKLGQKFIMADFTPSTDATMICESGRWEVDAKVATDVYCVNQQYDHEAHPDASISNGLVKCEMGSKCKYNNFSSVDRSKHSVVMSMDCACLPNGGQGYCPLAGEFSDLARQAKDNLNNKRHTSARKTPFNVNPKCAGYESRMWGTVEQCVKDVFGVGECSTSYVNMAFGLLALLFTLF